MTIKTSEGVILEVGYTKKGELKLVSDDGSNTRFVDAVLKILDENTLKFTLNDGKVLTRTKEAINGDNIILGMNFTENRSLLEILTRKPTRRYKIEWEESEGIGRERR